MRQDREYWSRLRVDPRSSLAAGLAIVAVLAAALAIIGLQVPGNQAAARGNPIYWAILLPVAWWASGLVAFEPRPVGAMKALTLLAPVAAAACLAAAHARGVDTTPWMVALVVCVLAAIGSRIAFRDSLLRREGPAR